MNTVRWVIPEAKEPISDAACEASASGPRAHGRPLRVGLLDNTKDNAHFLLQSIGERLQRELGAQVLLRRKTNATVAAPDAILEELAREADCIVTAMAD